MTDQPPAVSSAPLAALEVSSAAVSLRIPGEDLRVTADQAWRALVLWVRGDPTFTPSFVTTEIVEENETEIRKLVRHYVGTDSPSPPREQITRLYPGYLAVTHYTDGVYFTAHAGIDTTDGDDPKLFLMTVRHIQDPNYENPAIRAKELGVARPASAEDNLRRVVPLIHSLVREGRL